MTQKLMTALGGGEGYKNMRLKCPLVSVPVLVSQSVSHVQEVIRTLKMFDSH